MDEQAPFVYLRYSFTTEETPKESETLVTMATAPSTWLDQVSPDGRFAELLASPFEKTCTYGRDSCSLPSAIDRLQNVLSSLDLSFDSSKVGFIGGWLDSHAFGGKYYVVLPDIRIINSLTMVSA